MKISNVSYTLNNKRTILTKAAPQYTSFKAAQPKSGIFSPITKPFNKFMDSLTTKMAKGFAKFFENRHMKKLVERTKGNDNLTRFLTTIVSFVLSGFYMQQTLKNKDLDPKKRTTLAVNQGLSFILPTIGAWTLDGKTDKFLEKHFSDKYSAVNAKHLPRETALKLFHGIQCAKSIIIFGLFYRYLAPVLVTPLANHIGNMINERKQAKEA